MADNDIVINHLLEINRRLGELTVEVRNAADTMAAHANTDTSFHQSIGERVSSLESSVNRTKWMAMGGAGVIVGLFKAIEAYWMGHK